MLLSTIRMCLTVSPVADLFCNQRTAKGGEARFHRLLLPTLRRPPRCPLLIVAAASSLLLLLQLLRPTGSNF